jgi:hypothetical protein
MRHLFALAAVTRLQYGAGVEVRYIFRARRLGAAQARCVPQGGHDRPGGHGRTHGRRSRELADRPAVTRTRLAVAPDGPSLLVSLGRVCGSATPRKDGCSDCSTAPQPHQRGDGPHDQRGRPDARPAGAGREGGDPRAGGRHPTRPPRRGVAYAGHMPGIRPAGAGQAQGAAHRIFLPPAERRHRVAQRQGARMSADACLQHILQREAVDTAGPDLSPVADPMSWVGSGGRHFGRGGLVGGGSAVLGPSGAIATCCAALSGHGE